ncbi:hypothetical protein C8J56DRAFT_1050262 [Mycena floridula]|nr:hypothetical protein C8J56DRAFT_1050262 [Mycena floridula]
MLIAEPTTDDGWSHLDEEEDLTDDGLADFSPADRDKTSITLTACRESSYPKRIAALALHISQPKFPSAFLEFLFQLCHPNAEMPAR